MIDLVLWLFAIAATSMLAASLTSALGLRAFGPLLDRVEPRARARIWTFAALFPLVIAILVIGAILLPYPWLRLPKHSFGDDHLHLCLAHGAPPPSLAVIALALFFSARTVVSLAHEFAHAVRAALALRRLRKVGAEALDQVTRLPLDAPLAFTAGWLRPQIFVSRPIADAARWQAVIAHELDHARHRDPLVRLLVRLLVTLHAPGIAAWIVRGLESAQELAADEHAARAVGDRLEVAEQVLAFAREATRSPAVVVAFAEGDLAGRVGALLDTPRYVRGPSRAHGILIFAMGAALIALASTSIHYALEDLLASFGAG